MALDLLTEVDGLLLSGDELSVIGGSGEIFWICGASFLEVVEVSFSGVFELWSIDFSFFLGFGFGLGFSFSFFLLSFFPLLTVLLRVGVVGPPHSCGWWVGVVLAHPHQKVLPTSSIGGNK